MNVLWTKNAKAHLDGIYKYIAQDSKEYAKRIVDRLTQRSIQISDYPFSGRKVPEYDADKVREVIEGPYRIVYHIKQDQIDILAVIHGAMDILGTSKN